MPGGANIISRRLPPPHCNSTAMAEPQTLTATAQIGGSPAEASLSGGELWWCLPGSGGGGGGERRLELESEVLGCRAEGRRLKVTSFVEEEVETAPLGLSCAGAAADAASRIGRGEVVLEMESAEVAARWAEGIRDCFSSLGRPKRLFIIVNPFGGKRSGRKIFQAEVLPLIEAAGILYTLQETKYRLHAQEIAHSLDLRKYDGIICVSGDGVLVEVVNGLLQREDWNTAIKVPLGIIPAGTGNGMVKSLLHSAGETFSVSNAVFAIIRGHKRALDVTSIVQGKTKFFSVLMLTWGLVADIDIESEKYRWMGSARLGFYSLLRIANLRRYTGRVVFVPAPGYEGFGEPVEQIESDKWNDDSTVVQEPEARNCTAESCTYTGSSIGDADLEWRSLNGPFISVWLGNVPWASEDVMPAPEAKFSDGYLDVAIIRDCPRSVVLRLILQTSDGSYVKSPYVDYLKVKAFRIEPGPHVGNRSMGGIIDSDGEVIARGDRSPDGEQEEHLMAYGPPIQMTVDKGLAAIFCPR